MATTKAVTGMVVNSVRTNDDGSAAMVVTVTYADTTTDVLEFLIDRIVP